MKSLKFVGYLFLALSLCGLFGCCPGHRACVIRFDSCQTFDYTQLDQDHPFYNGLP